jgi:hypothetical protein
MRHTWWRVTSNTMSQVSTIPRLIHVGDDESGVGRLPSGTGHPHLVIQSLMSGNGDTNREHQDRQRRICHWHSPKNFLHNALKVGKRVPIVEINQSCFPGLPIDLFLCLLKHLWVEKESQRKGLQNGTGLPKHQRTLTRYNYRPPHSVRRG